MLSIFFFLGGGRGFFSYFNLFPKSDTLTNAGKFFVTDDSLALCRRLLLSLSLSPCLSRAVSTCNLHSCLKSHQKSPPPPHHPTLWWSLHVLRMPIKTKQQTVFLKGLEYPTFMNENKSILIHTAYKGVLHEFFCLENFLTNLCACFTTSPRGDNRILIFQRIFSWMLLFFFIPIEFLRFVFCLFGNGIPISVDGPIA